MKPSTDIETSKWTLVINVLSIASFVERARGEQEAVALAVKDVYEDTQQPHSGESVIHR
jgi:hypothetical protein